MTSCSDSDSLLPLSLHPGEECWFNLGDVLDMCKGDGVIIGLSLEYTYVNVLLLALEVPSILCFPSFGLTIKVVRCLQNVFVVDFVGQAI